VYPYKCYYCTTRFLILHLVACVLSFLWVRVEPLPGVLMSQHPISHFFTPPTSLVFPLSACLVWGCAGKFLFILQYGVRDTSQNKKFRTIGEKWVPDECCWGRPRVEQLPCRIPPMQCPRIRNKLGSNPFEHGDKPV